MGFGLGNTRRSPIAASAMVITVVAGGTLLTTGPAEATVGQISYVISGETATVGDGSQGSGCTGGDCPSQIVIPATVSSGGTDYPVVAIAALAFAFRPDVSSVDLSGATNLISIGSQAFYQDSNVTPHGPSSLNLGFTVQTIGELAFAGSALQHLDIPSGVTSIGATAFASIPELQSVQIGSQVTTIGNAAFGLDPNLNEVHFLGPQPSVLPASVFADSCSTPCSLRFKHEHAASWQSAPDVTPNVWVDTDVPAISTQPHSQSVSVGNDVNMSTSATGNGNLYYQWRRNDVVIDGANSSTLTVGNPTSANNGAAYTVEVSNWVGTTESDPAIVTITAAPKRAQSMRVSLPRVFKKNRAYSLPVRTLQGQRITWAVTGAGRCRVTTKGKATCRASTGKRQATFVARAGSTSALLAMTQAVRRSVK